MPIEHIDSTTDPRLADFREIRERDLHGRDGIFIGEQPLIVERMLSIPSVTRSVLVIDRREAWLRATIENLGAHDVECYVAPHDVVSTLAGFDVHRGILASGNRAPFDNRTLGDVLPSTDQPAVILCCESINNIDNIGALFRIGAAFGVDALILDETCHDPLYRKSLRVSIGHALTIPFVRSTSWRDDLLAIKETHGCTLIGASTAHGSDLHHDVPQFQRLALILGSEFEGLREESAAVCDVNVRIPMAPGVDSLNVGVAAAVLLDRLSSTFRS